GLAAGFLTLQSTGVLRLAGSPVRSIVPGFAGFLPPNPVQFWNAEMQMSSGRGGGIRPSQSPVQMLTQTTGGVTPGGHAGSGSAPQTSVSPGPLIRNVALLEP